MRALAFLGLAAALIATPATAQPTRLFREDAPLAITLEGPITAIAATNERSEQARPATLILGEQRFAIQLSPRGVSRRREDVCSFPPMRITFEREAVRGTIFQGQSRLKLVTHCRPRDTYVEQVVREYLAYRIYNLITPLSYRVRALDVTYADGARTSTYFGFVIEDVDDLARRNERVELEVGSGGINVDQFDPEPTETLALFQYMIGNLDWDYRQGPRGEDCCHNARLAARQGETTAVIPLPYDFDFSGLVNAPYAVPPANINVNSVRVRFFRGRCRHNDALPGVIARFQSQRAAIDALIAGEARLSDSSRNRMQSYLAEFWSILDDPARVQSQLVRRCIQ